MANQLWCIDFLIPPTLLIIPHRLPAFLESLMPHKNWCSIHARWSKISLRHSIHFCGIFSKFKTGCTYIYIYIKYIYIYIPAYWHNGWSVHQKPRRLELNHRSSHTKDKKWYLMPPYPLHYKVWIKSKWRNLVKGLAPFTTPWCSSYLKRSLPFTHGNGWPTMYVYIYISGKTEN